MFKSCVTMFMYATACTLGYKAGLHLWEKIEAKLEK